MRALMMRRYLIWKVQICIIILVLIIGLTSCSDSPNGIDSMGEYYLLGEQFSEVLEEPASSIGTETNLNHEILIKQNADFIDESVVTSILETVPETLLAFEAALDVLGDIKKHDYLSLAKYAHPEKGIIFSSNAFVNYDEDPVFKAEQIEAFNFDTVYSWGYYEASEIPLELTANEYFDLYVYSKDFIHCRQVGINSIIRSGNCPENVAETFPSGIFIEFHDEGTKEFDQLDWSSLKIVLEKCNGTFKVVAIVSSMYTL